MTTVLDGIVSTPGLNPPFFVFVLFGAWKIPLTIAWAFAIGLMLLRMESATAVRADRDS